MDTLTDAVIEVPLDDLQIIRAALNSAYHHSTVLDLAEQYRKLHQRPQESKLTQALKNALTLLVAYMETDVGPNEEVPDAPE